MLVYYSGFDKKGDKFHRFDEVPDVDDLYDTAEKNDEELIQLVELPAALAVLVLTGNRKLKNKEVVEFCQQLATYIDGGVDLASIFKDIQVEPVSRVMQNTVKKISASLNDGDTLSSSFRKTNAFPDIVITLVEIGEKSGSINQALKDAAMYLEREIELRSSTYRALIYPIFTLTIMLIGLVFWIGFVIPQVVLVIQTMDVELPIQTQMLLVVSEFMQAYWIVELVFIIIMMLVIFVGRTVKFFRYFLDKLWWYMPITGKVVISSQMAFYFNYFKVLYDAGIPVADILTRLQQSVPSHYFQKQIAISNASIKEGDSLQLGYEKAKIFEAIAIRVIGVGEQTGNLEKQLDLLGGVYLKRVQLFVETLPKVLEPIFITVIGIFFILFASTLLGPLYEVIVKLGVAV